MYRGLRLRRRPSSEPASRTTRVGRTTAVSYVMSSRTVVLFPCGPGFPATRDFIRTSALLLSFQSGSRGRSGSSATTAPPSPRSTRTHANSAPSLRPQVGFEAPECRRTVKRLHGPRSQMDRSSFIRARSAAKRRSKPGSAVAWRSVSGPGRMNSTAPSRPRRNLASSHTSPGCPAVARNQSESFRGPSSPSGGLPTVKRSRPSTQPTLGTVDFRSASTVLLASSWEPWSLSYPPRMSPPSLGSSTSTRHRTPHGRLTVAGLEFAESSFPKARIHPLVAADPTPLTSGTPPREDLPSQLGKALSPFSSELQVNDG